jgi:hypothetical protein
MLIDKVTIWGPPAVDNPVWEICERVAEVQALLHDHVECGQHSAADVVAKAKPCCRNPNCCALCSTSATSRRPHHRRNNQQPLLNTA